jgi:hypothetical protein
MSDFDVAVELAIEMCDHGGSTVCVDCSRRGKRLVPTVLRYADAQVAAERKRIAAAIRAIKSADVCVDWARRHVLRIVQAGEPS